MKTVRRMKIKDMLENNIDTARNVRENKEEFKRAGWFTAILDRGRTYRVEDTALPKIIVADPTARRTPWPGINERLKDKLDAWISEVEEGPL